MSQLDDVMKLCNLTEYHKEIAELHYKEALEFLKDAGVPEKVALSEKANGCIARYVDENMALNGAAVELSKTFYARLKQLQIREVMPDEED